MGKQTSKKNSIPVGCHTDDKNMATLWTEWVVQLFVEEEALIQDSKNHRINMESNTK